MIEAKNVFDYLNDKELNDARQRANPYETIKGAIFQNRWEVIRQKWGGEGRISKLFLFIQPD